MSDVPGTAPKGAHRRPNCPHGDRRADGYGGGADRMCARCRATRLRRLSLWSAGFAAAAVVLGVFSAWTAHRLAGYVAENRAYHDARPCPANEPARRDCLKDVPVVVSAVVDVNGRSPRHELYLVGEGLAYRSVAISGSGPVLRHLDPGDTVVATLWRARVVALRADGRVEKTYDTPHHDAALAALAVGLAVPLVPVLVRIAVWLPRNRRRVADDELQPGVDAWGPADAGLVAAAAASAVAYLIPPLPGVGEGLTAQAVTAAVVAALACTATWYATPRVRNRRLHAKRRAGDATDAAGRPRRTGTANAARSR